MPTNHLRASRTKRYLNSDQKVALRVIIESLRENAIGSCSKLRITCTQMSDYLRGFNFEGDALRFHTMYDEIETSKSGLLRALDSLQSSYEDKKPLETILEIGKIAQSHAEKLQQTAFDIHKLTETYVYPKTVDRITCEGGLRWANSCLAVSQNLEHLLNTATEPLYPPSVKRNNTTYKMHFRSIKARCLILKR